MAERLGIYLKVADNEHPDFERIACSSVALISAARELSYVLDPSVEIKFEFIATSEGSLVLNTLIKIKEDAQKIEKRTLLACIALTVAGWLANDIRSYGVEKLLDNFFQSSTKFTKEEIKEIATIVEKNLDRNIAQRKIEMFYLELQRDRSILGVGAISLPNQCPTDMVPREQFPARAGLSLGGQEVHEQRTKRELKTLILISPVLADERRRWKFRSADGEIGAYMRDRDFLHRVLEGRSDLTMRSGIRLDVIISAKEQKENGVWVVKERAIDKVLDTHPAPEQELISFDPPSPEITEDNDDE